MEEIKAEEGKRESINFIEEQLLKDLAEGKNGKKVQTRFPPEPNGYLHIGHAKAIALDFGLAEKYGGVCNLRMDDTNPQKEDTEYVEAIKRDIEWLGFKWGNIYYASDYFQQLWDFAVALIKKGRAYIDEQTAEQIAEQKGTPTQAGTNSPYRDRPVEENLRLFEEMNSGKMEPGKMVLRAKIDMASPNMHFRDPIMYRVLNMPHWRTGNKWNAYPMYDFTHGQCDYWEGVTHSWCTLEFVSHRPLYDLFVDWAKEVDGTDNPIDDNRPRQTEFNKLNLTHILLSKRNLLILVNEGVVNGWDDPRMPTICGFRRRGYSPEGILSFIDKIGYTKFDALNQMSLFESAVRDDLNKRAQRVSAVVNPVKLVIDNFPEGEVETYTAINNPENEADGTHEIEFSRELWIEREDFMEDAPKKFFRLGPGKQVRLKNSYIIECSENPEECIRKDADGNITEIHANLIPDTKTGQANSNMKIKGKTIHWVSCNHCLEAEVRNYDRLWMVENPRDEVAAYSKEHGDVRGIEAMRPFLNPNSLEIKKAYVEKWLATRKPMDYLQFQRIGYYNVDPDSTPEHLVFNRTVGLTDAWKKINK
ncbi:MAG: glutamine--tRNA ligase/YqeY domain fusion protein [Bacteroidaceae bacterium]|nr:glutamine--tRNA ligase/YqeY domain fusion protein [Bacteroidaceae bacterium]MBR1519799.1 glutamine--tRNA ligase/YqeY domain fusion protein [Bacteroidaceae bacterium]